MKKSDKLIYPDLSYRVTGILFATHNELGRFYNEKQYSDTIEGHLNKLKIKYEREKTLPSSFRYEKEGRNKIDFLIDNRILLEIKAKRLLVKADYYQVRRYLSALNIKLGLLVNFRDKYIKPRRILNSRADDL
jgi:GxxExxY protein